MTKHTKVICDSCGKEILKGRFCYRDFYLRLSPAFRPDAPSQSSSPLPIDGTMDFCNKECLYVWVSKKIGK